MTLTPADSLAGKVAIVTGARRGIGRAEAILLAERGASVVVNGLAHGGDDSVESLADEIRSNGGQAVAEVCSVASFESGEQLVDRALSEFGRIDIIVNTAGVVRMTPVELATDEDWDFMVNVNLKGTYATARAALRQFKKQGSGIIVNTSSDAGTGDFYNSIYAATKEGVLGMTRAIAREYGRYGIRCNAIRPRAFDTGMTSPQTFSRQYGFAEQFGVPACGSHRFTPRDGTAAEVAEVVAWLCTDAASHLNGQLQVGCGELGLWAEPTVARSSYEPSGLSRDGVATAAGYLFADCKDPYAMLPPEAFAVMDARVAEVVMRSAAQDSERKS